MLLNRLFPRSAGRSKTPGEALHIFDDIFPQPLSAFRLAEFNAYLAHFPRAQVHSTGGAFRYVGETRPFAQVLAEYERQYPAFRGRVQQLDPRREYRGRPKVPERGLAPDSGNRGLAPDSGNRGLAYAVFLNNAYQFVHTLDLVERQRTPFAFTLYPGGGFQLEQPLSDEKLRRVCGSPCLRKVIVTQTVARDYLIERGFCDPALVELIYGVVLPADRLALDSGNRGLAGTARPRRRYGLEKDTFDLCFVAHKYMPRAADKGYDVFVEVAHALAAAHPDARFHVVGGIGPGEIDVSAINGRISFHGPRPTDFFPAFYAGMDLILSPNAPFLLAPGAFDGFPTGGCVEAGLCGVAVFCTDPLGLNVAFKDGEELV
ncbi:MAG: glycosyltransferase family 4 protein, partial [Chloroflexi bacterium]|nr:glycosyltransferase family 4 protein [Chloroflexota bacterium]